MKKTTTQREQVNFLPERTCLRVVLVSVTPHQDAYRQIVNSPARLRLGRYHGMSMMPLRAA